MAITTYNDNYYDDLNIPDLNGSTPLDKNYLRVLFRPGVSVQTRELNQIQSAIQAQLDRLGESIFRSGKPVLGGLAQFDDSSKVSSLDFPAADLNLPEGISLDQFKTISKSLSGSTLSASIVKIKGDVNGYVRVYYKVSSNEEVSTGNVDNFVPGDGVILSFVSDEDEDITSPSYIVSSVQRAVSAHVGQGVYFTKGSYVVVHDQVAVYDVDSKFTGYVALKINENIVSVEDDQTLNDNASGSYNYGAPGADRYAIDLSLELITSLPNNEEHITLLTVTNDIITLDNAGSAGPGSTIDDKLAQRTYEESGDYEVQPFAINITEAYNDGTNGGLYTTEDLVTAGYVNGSSMEPDIEAAKNDLVVRLDPSVAYVKGYRVELKNSIPISVKKARETSAVTPLSISANMGMYVDVELALGTAFPKIQSSSALYTFVPDTYVLGGYNYTLGTARIRTIEYLGNNVYRVFLYDVTLDENTIIDNQVSLIQIDDNVVLRILSPLQQTDNPYGFFKLPYSPIKNISDLRFTYKKAQTFVGSATTTTVSVSTGTVTDTIDISPSNILVQIKRVNGDIINNPSFSVLSNTSANTLNLTINGTQVGDSITVITSVTSDARRGTKRLKQVTTSFTPQSLSINPSKVYTLNGVYHLVSIDGDFEIINDGQNDAHYSPATIKYNGSATASFNITYTYFEFSDDADFFDSNSYLNIDGTAMSIDDVPVYKSIPLYTVLDFRYYYDPEDLGATFRPIDAYSAITYGSIHYLPRIDSVLVSQSGSFYINQGKPSEDPKKPTVPDTAMELYTLTLAPYTFGPADVEIQKLDNQRYTMSNIRAIDKRVSNLEYYTTLSLLEKTAKDTSITTDGIDRFKNGFVVDSFTGHNVGDPSNPDYMCAIDEDSNELRPAFNVSSFKLDVDETNSSNVTIHDRAATLRYNSIPYISQQYGSDAVSVNPFASPVYVGKLRLYPQADHFYATDTRPEVITKNDENRKDGIRYLGKKFTTESTYGGTQAQVLGTEWKSWETYWSGKKKRGRNSSAWFGAKSTTLNAAEYNIDKNINDYRNKVVTSDQTKIEKNDKTVDINIRPYIRSRYVYFRAESLKPNTIYYPFFDGVRVSDHCYAMNQANFKKRNNLASNGGENLPKFKGPNVPLRTNGHGRLYGVFIIPNTKKLRFLSGVRQFKLADVGNLQSEYSSYATSDYYSTGLIRHNNKAIVSNSVPETTRTSIIDSRAATANIRTSAGNKISWVDPIAQSFLINNPEGIFATKVDLYFSSKPSIDVPVEVYIVTMENGIPTQNLVPLSSAYKNRDEVNINAKGFTATTFEFEQPIYLSPGQEYALVVTSVSAEYRVYVSTLGQHDDLTKQLISANPYGGVFFRSQNSSTWSPNQTKDLKFKLYRAKFESSGTLKSSVESLFSVERIDIINGGSGYTSAPTVTISAPLNGTTATAEASVNLTKASEIALTYDDETNNIYNGGGSGYTAVPTVTISAPQNGTTATAVAVLPSAKVSSFVLDQDVIEISSIDEQNPNKNISCGVSNSVNILNYEYVNIEQNETYHAYGTKREWSFPGVNYAYPLNVSTRLTTTSNYISPVVDIDRMSVKLIANRILPKGTTSEQQLENENATSKYITRSIQLSQLADRLDIYFDVNRPNTSCDIKVYVQFNDPSSARTETQWIEIAQRVRPIILPTSSDPDVFSEVHYKIEREDEYPFNSFKVKIVFNGENIVDVPRIKNFRAIATTL